MGNPRAGMPQAFKAHRISFQRNETAKRKREGEREMKEERGEVRAREATISILDMSHRESHCLAVDDEGSRGRFIWKAADTAAFHSPRGTGRWL